MNIRRTHLLPMILAMTGCASLASQADNLEPLYAVALQGQTLTIEVKSTGCTKAEDFKLTIDQTGTANRLRVERLTPDRCRRMPMIIAIEKSLADSGIDQRLPVMLENPLSIKTKP